MKSENDDGDDAASSRYSSCGESEFDRYCSATSAMGTPSVCSSVMVIGDLSPELEFGGNSRSSGLGFGDEIGGSGSFSLGEERIERGGEGTKRLSDGIGASYGSGGLEMYGNEGDDEIGFSGIGDGLMSWKNIESLPSKGVLEIGNGGHSDDDDDDDDGKDDGEEHGLDRNVSATEEHSEGEESIYNYGLDDDEKFETRYFTETETETKDENPLVMNSSVAFGLGDWVDFVEESGGLAAPLNLTMKDKVPEDREENKGESERESSDSANVNSRVCTIDTLILDVGVLPEVEDHVKDIPVASYQVQDGNEVIEFTKSSFTTAVIEKVHEQEKEDASRIPSSKNHDECDVVLADFHPVAEEFVDKIGFDNRNEYEGTTVANQYVSVETVGNGGDGRVSEMQGVASAEEVTSRSKDLFRDMKLNLLEDSRQREESSSTLMSKTRKNHPVSDDRGSGHLKPVKTEALDRNECHDEFVHEMEEILLASNDPGTRFSHSNRALQSHIAVPVRDGGSSASTSGTDDAYRFSRQPLRIDGVEVIGARQKDGDVSLVERLVGGKKHTTYKIRVWSGNDQWEVERRCRDFFTLFRLLRTLFADHGLVLPTAWDTVEKESRNIFGNVAPDVVAKRSVLIQECLLSILHPRFFASTQSALSWFLCPQDSGPSSPASNSPLYQSVSLGNGENISTLGRTISLIVEIQPSKSTKQMLEVQHYTCAGCYKHFNDGKTLIQDFAQTLGWGKPRLCEYTNQLFCSSCHTNEAAVLPARVLHNWDFTQYPVSQLAKSYLDSIHDQPMLCVSAVNPFLFSKVPTLLHVMGVRRKIGSILSYVRCSFRGSINRSLGSRRYLLQSNDFFALRDLIDLSKGAFAVLPVMVETVLKKIVEHITEQCLVCCDVGVPCAARQACNDPSSLIFPFQEGDIEKCPSCESEFHKACFKKLTDCYCGSRLRVNNNMGLSRRLSHGGDSSGALEFLGKGLGSGSSLGVGFLSGFFTKGKPANQVEERDGDNIILMGSLPSTTL